MSDPHAPYRILRNIDRRIAEDLYRIERQHHYLDELRLGQRDAQEAAAALLMLEAELRSLRSERDALIRALSLMPESTTVFH
ncbi:hypothetical protein [Achromobacter aloeverae]